MQKRALDVLRTDGSTYLTRARYEEITGVSRSQAAYDLAELVQAGIITRIGGGRATRYRLTQAPEPARSERRGRRQWTNERIRAELERFCAERETWPSAAEFKAAGHSDLYVAASRYGGVGFWASELGFSRPGRPETPAAAAPPRPRRQLRPRMPVRWAAAAAVIAAAALVATGGARVDSWHGVPTLRSSLPLRVGVPGFVPKRLPESTTAAKRSTPRAAKKKEHGKPARRVTRTRSTQTVRAPSSGTELVVQRTPAPTYSASRQAAPPPPPPPPPPSTGSGGPAPLPPPSGGGGPPQPIPPPHR
jgi:DNA-binding Lrp family transcriptional regulator